MAEDIADRDALISELRGTLEDMCIQFAFTTTLNGAPALSTGGLSALEGAFDALQWDDPHPIEWDKCDEPGCDKRTSCGFPTPNGYRRTCGEHSQIGKPAQGERSSQEQVREKD